MRLHELVEEFDFAAWKASLPPGEGEIAYVIHLSRVMPAVVLGKTNAFEGSHEVEITSKGGHKGLLYPKFGVDLFNTEEEAKKALFMQKLKNKPERAIHEDSEDHTVPPEVAKEFMKIADHQRGDPEHAMLRVQHAYKGGVLSPVVEHVGDLQHRMTEHADANMWLEDIIREKVERGLRYLTHGYGFEREMQENIRANNVDVEKLDKLLLEYAREHQRLPVYNAAHYHARSSCIAIGKQQWTIATDHLKVLKQMLDSGAYKRVASSYLLDGEGKLLQYRP